MQRRPVAIIDIGSNSVRLVVYAGADRIPSPIFNEKVMAGLGAGLAANGKLSDQSQDKALAALRRFRLLLRHMGVRQVRVVATAAARDASNGPEFIHAIEKVGFDCQLLSPEQEAWLAGEGVLSGTPDADGIVGDLGGGSLELVEVKDGVASRGISLPLGVLRVKNDGRSTGNARQLIRRALEDSGLASRGRGRSFYMVGGSWRALARIDMAVTEYPLPINHGYTMRPERAGELVKLLASGTPLPTKRIAPARLASSPVAAQLLAGLVDELEPSAITVSSVGIREGLLFSQLKPSTRSQDPLLAAARDAGGSDRRFGEHGDVLDSWIASAFDDPPSRARLRHAACLLADFAWQANPMFRAERAVEMALHGNWLAVTAPERVLIAQALSSSFGVERLPDQAVTKLCANEDLRQAHRWGLAMRLGQRLSGGVGSILQASGLARRGDTIEFRIARRDASLISEAVRRRLERLAQALGLTAAVGLT